MLYFGDSVTLEAVLEGYDKVNYTIQWRYSTDNENWNNCPGETNEKMTFVVSESNYQCYWNILVTVTGVK